MEWDSAITAHKNTKIYHDVFFLNEARTHFNLRIHRPQAQYMVGNKLFADFLLYVKMLGLKFLVEKNLSIHFFWKNKWFVSTILELTVKIWYTIILKVRILYIYL